MAGRSWLVSPRLLPLLIACGITGYGAMAAVSTEPLTGLLALVRHSLALQLLLWFLPLSQAARMLYLLRYWQARRRALHGGTQLPAGLDTTVVTLAGALPAEAADRLTRAGYRVLSSASGITAWRGVSSVPFRALGCLALALVSSGLIVSITGREVRRVPLVAGEPLPSFLATPGVVKGVDLQETPEGTIFARRLTVRISQSDGAERDIWMFPPSRIGGWWYYPRYLGLAPLFSFTASDPPVSLEDYHLLTLYPPGVEDTAVIPGTPYRVVVRLAENEVVPATAGSLHLRVKGGDELLGSGTIAVGGALDFRGGRLRMLDIRAMVTVDFVRDAGLPCIWLGMVLGVVALTGWELVRICWPHRELQVISDATGVTGLSRAEGRTQRHDELFHGLLDQVGPTGRDGSIRCCEEHE